MKKKLFFLFIIFLLVFSIFPIFKNTVSAGWWDNNWESYVSIYVKQENIVEDLYDFPILIEINSSIAQHCNNGNSIRFISVDNTTEYSYEIEKWNASGISYVWVKIPHITHDENTYFNMYYNNSLASDNQNITDVWSNNFTAVWHLNESSGTLYDSTSNNYDLTNNGATYVSSGHIAGAYTFDGINDFMNVSNFNPNDVGALSFITQRGCSSCGRRRFAGAVDNFEVVVRGDNLLTNHLYVLGAGILTGTAYTDTVNCRHLSFSYNYSSNLNEIYQDSMLDGSGYLADDPPGSNLEFEIAHSNWFAGEYYHGCIDEFRVHSHDRNSSWWRAEYENTINASNFTVWATPYNQADVPPLQYNEIPGDGNSSDILPTLFITVDDDFDRDLDVYFYSNVTGTWQLFGQNLTVNTTSGAVILQQYNANFTTYNVTYWWSVNVTNGASWNNQTYSFTTIQGHIPDVYDFTPAHNSTNVYLPVSLGVRVVDIDGHSMNITFYTNATGTWQTIGTVAEVYDGTYYVYGTDFTLYNHTYYWKVKVTDELGLTNTTVYAQTFKFTTATEPQPTVVSPCSKMTCCEDNYIYVFFGLFGIFGLLSIAFYTNKR